MSIARRPLLALVTILALSASAAPSATDIHPTVAASCAIYAGAIVYQALRARDRRGYCLKIKYPKYPVVVVLVPQIYSGRYCR